MRHREREVSGSSAEGPGARRAAPVDPSPSAPPAGQADPAQTTTFEAGLERLAGIVDRLEAGELGLVESIDAYEQGIGLIRMLHGQLATCEQRVEVLAAEAEVARGGTEADGRTSVRAGSSSPAPGRTPGTAAPRVGRSRKLPGMDDSSETV